MSGQASDLRQQMAFFKLADAGRAPGYAQPHYAAPAVRAQPSPAHKAPTGKTAAPRKPTPVSKPAAGHALHHAAGAHDDKEWKEF